MFKLGTALLLGIAWALPADLAAPFPNIEVAPKDEGPADKSFAAFRDSLSKVIDKRNVDELLKAVDPDIKCGFGGDDGVIAFVQTWELKTEPAKSRIWQELREVLRLGGAFMDFDGDKLFIAPYTHTEFPGELEPYEFGLVTGAGVRIRSEPGSKSKEVAKVSYAAVRFLDDAEPKEESIGDETFPWRKVALADGTQGYIWGKYVRSPIDFRAGFSKKSGEWRMTFFVAGD
ncbi:MAG: hypothetical protein AMXMBFR84_04390 [Candidatus Hydrogenedentota bacterium]